MSRRAPWILAIALALAGAPACGGGQKKSAGELVKRLPPEGKQVIYESENDVIMARNQRDTALLAVETVEREIGEVGHRWQQTQARLKAAGKGDRLGPARRMVDAHQRFLRVHLEVARVGIELADAGIALARAKLERARHGELVRFGMAPGAALGRLDEGVARADKRLRSLEQKDMSVRSREQKAFETWKLAEEQYARDTGDHDTAIWID